MDTTPDETGHDAHDGDDDETLAFDELAARAGAALRRPAPDRGLRDIARRGRRRQLTIAAAAGSAVVLLIGGGFALWNRDSDTAPIAPVATADVEKPNTTTSTDTALTTNPATTTTSPAPGSLIDTFTTPGNPLGALFLTDGRILIDLPAATMVQDTPGGTFATYELDPYPDHAVPHFPQVADDGTKVASHGVVWDTTSGEQLFSDLNASRFSLHQPSLGAVRPFNPDGTRILAVPEEMDRLHGRATIFNIGSGEPELTVETDDYLLLTASFNPDGTKFVTSGFATPSVWDAMTGERLLSISEDLDDFVMATFSPDGNTILTVGDMGNVRLRDAVTGDLRFDVTTEEGPIAYFSPDGTKILLASAGVSILDALTGNTITELGRASHEELSTVGPHAFSPDGDKIVTATGTTTATVWDTTTGRVLGTLTTQTGNVLTAAFSPGGSHIITAHDDASIRVWTSP